jgi:hypothetical protein
MDIDLNEPINWDDIDEEYSGDVFDMNSSSGMETGAIMELLSVSRLWTCW